MEKMIELSGKDFFQIRNNFNINKSKKSLLLYGKRKKDPVVSIMIPTFLRNNYLSETIDSVLKQNTTVSYEIVVVDNNPEIEDETTLSLIKNYCPEKIAYYKNPCNLGMFGNWNRCLELALGEWVLILHDDDTIMSDYIDKMMKIVQQYPEVSCVGCGYTLIDAYGKEILLPLKSKKWRYAESLLKRTSYPIKIKDFYYVHPIDIMGLFINRSKAIEIGGFDNTWDPTSDYIFILNLADRYNIRCTDDKLINYRQAVNASLSPKHLIGMVEVDAYMRKDINRHLSLMNEKKSEHFRSALVQNHEKCLIDNWFSKIDIEQNENVLREYQEFNKYFGISDISDKDKNLVVKKQGYYNFWMRFFRK